MNCQSLFSGKNKKNIISLSSAELDQRVLKVKYLKTNHPAVDWFAFLHFTSMVVWYEGTLMWKLGGR